MATNDFPETMCVESAFQQTDKSVLAPVLNGNDRHRQNGEGSMVPQGAIIQPSHWGWVVASVMLVAVIFAFVFNFFPSDLMSLAKWALSLR